MNHSINKYLRDKFMQKQYPMHIFIHKTIALKISLIEIFLNALF